MGLENINLQARDPQRTGEFWAGALGLSGGGLSADGVWEGRLDLGPFSLDICIDPVPHAPPSGWRLHQDLRGGAEQQAVVERLMALGATRADIGQGDVPWVVLADPDGNAFCVMEERAAYRDTGPIAALPLDSANPERDAGLYAALTGWVRVPGAGPLTLRHPSLHGPLLELCPEPAPKVRQNARTSTCVPSRVVRIRLGSSGLPYPWAPRERPRTGRRGGRGSFCATPPATSSACCRTAEAGSASRPVSERCAGLRSWITHPSLP